MPSMNLVPITGVIQDITAFGDDCCQRQVSIRNSDGISNFIVGPDTYVINEVRLRPGMNVAAFYDASLPIPLIFPPGSLYWTPQSVRDYVCRLLR